MQDRNPQPMRDRHAGPENKSIPTTGIPSHGQLPEWAPGMLPEEARGAAAVPVFPASGAAASAAAA